MHTVDIMVMVNRTVLSNVKSLFQSSVVSYPSSMAVKTYLLKAWRSSKTALKIKYSYRSLA